MSTKHPGFNKVAAKMAKKEHVPVAEARKMLASATRHAGASARKHNPRLNRVKGY